jgi:hypothetical protein
MLPARRLLGAIGFRGHRIPRRGIARPDAVTFSPRTDAGYSTANRCPPRSPWKLLPARRRQAVGASERRHRDAVC